MDDSKEKRGSIVVTVYGNGDQKTQEEAAAVTNDDDADNNKVGHDDDEDERSRAEPSQAKMRWWGEGLAEDPSKEEVPRHRESLPKPTICLQPTKGQEAKAPKAPNNTASRRHQKF